MTNPGAPDGVTIRTVSQISAEIRNLLERSFANVWVEGEISKPSRPSSGHHYFVLKDASANLKAVIFRGAALRMPRGFEPREGAAVVAFGRITVYEPKGDYQLSIERIFPKGLGEGELALRALREKLSKLGYFDPRRKRKPPTHPKNVALVTSATGAAIRDLITILGRRWPLTRVFVRPSRVQGEGAAAEIASAIMQLNRWAGQGHLSLDCIILGRGGGSAEDLSAFNEEIVAQAIYESKVPIVSAVGHEIDNTLADSVADVRAVTPSHAAEIIVPDRIQVLDDLRETGDRIHEAMRRRINLARRRLDGIASRRAFRNPLDRIRDRERRLDDLAERLTRAARMRLHLARQQLGAVAARIEALSPLNVLARGYSLTMREPTNALIRSADQLKPGDTIATILQHGRVISRVEKVDSTDARGKPVLAEVIDGSTGT
jgi:exodeoxyribonuclease VII large subunit